MRDVSKLPSVTLFQGDDDEERSNGIVLTKRDTFWPNVLDLPTLINALRCQNSWSSFRRTFQMGGRRAKRPWITTDSKSDGGELDDFFNRQRVRGHEEKKCRENRRYPDNLIHSQTALHIVDLPGSKFAWRVNP